MSENMNLPQNQVPFVDLKDFSEGKYSIVKLSEKYPDFIVKESRTKQRNENRPSFHPLKNNERRIKDAEAIINSFREFIPKTLLIIGKNEKGEEIIYVVQEKVIGKRLDELNYSEEIAQELRTFFDKVISNYLQHLSPASPSKQVESVSFLPDIARKNFMLGTTKNNKKTKLYFIDVYPKYTGTPSEVINEKMVHLITKWPHAWKKFWEEETGRFKRKLTEKGAIPKEISL